MESIQVTMKLLNTNSLKVFLMQKFLLLLIALVFTFTAIGATESKIIYSNGKPQFLINGKEYETLMYMYPYKWPMEKESFRRQIEMFKKSDIHLYGVCFQLHEFVNWPDGSQKQCFAPNNEVALFEVEKRIKDCLEADPDAYIMFCITAGYHTIWWEKAHPEECIAYPNTTVDYKCNNDGGNYITPSVASKVWRKDLCNVLEQICEAIKKSPYGDREARQTAECFHRCSYHRRYQ